MFGILRKNKGKAYMAISLLILIVISTLAGFCASVTVAHAEDQTVTKREKYGLKVYDYPELAGQEGISKTGYTFDGWYMSATGGTKIDEASWTTPLAENTDLYAHWKPNAYPLKVTYNTDVFNNITVTLKRNNGSNVRSLTLGNNGSCTILFDDIVTITANRKGDYTEGSWIYDDGTHRHKKRHYYNFGSWSMQTASNDPVKPSLANAAAQTTSFTLTATGGVTLNVTGSHTTGNVDHQSKVPATPKFTIHWKVYKDDGTELTDKSGSQEITSAENLTTYINNRQQIKGLSIQIGSDGRSFDYKNNNKSLTRQYDIYVEKDGVRLGGTNGKVTLSPGSSNSFTISDTWH